MNRIVRLLPAIPLFVVLSACAVLPVGIGEENLLDEGSLDFIVIGNSTKREISSAMSKHLSSEPGASVAPVEFKNGDWWLYTQTRKEGKWLVWVVSDGGIIGKVDYRFLLIKFDASGVVQDYEVSKSEGNECNLEGVCIGNTPPPQLLAPFGEDRVAKGFKASQDRCHIYVYGTPNMQNAQLKVIPVLLNGREAGQIVDRKQYFFWQLDPGPHQLSAFNSSRASKRSLMFECRPGAQYFFEFHGYELELRERSMWEGRADIRKRWMTLES